MRKVGVPETYTTNGSFEEGERKNGVRGRNDTDWDSVGGTG